MLNLTLHLPTKEQSEAGVVEASPEIKSQVKALLTFESLPSKEKIQKRAEKLAAIAVDHKSALIGGAPWLMSWLEWHLKSKGVQPFYSFSQRVSVEKVMEDGSVKKTNVFRHLGFIKA